MDRSPCQLEGAPNLASETGGLQSLLRLAENSSEAKDFGKALEIYTHCIELCGSKEEKYVLYSYRSRVYLEIGNFDSSLEDANNALEGNCGLVLCLRNLSAGGRARMKCMAVQGTLGNERQGRTRSIGHFEEGQAYICKAESLIALERLVDALVVYSDALENYQSRIGKRNATYSVSSENPVDDADFSLVLQKLVTCCCDDLSPIKDTFPAVYSSLAEIGLSTRPAVILTEIGQELLTVGYHAASLSILQNALKCGTKSLKVRGCILGALTSAHWTAGNYDTAVQFMKEDLQVATQLGDFAAQSRCLSNLRSGHLSVNELAEALESEKENFKVNYKWYQSTQSEDAHEGMALSLSQQGTVYRLLNDNSAALSSFKESANIYHKIGNLLAKAQQLGNAGVVHELMADLESAFACHLEHRDIAARLENNMEVARACYNLGTVSCQLGRYSESIGFFNQTKQAGSDLKDNDGAGGPLDSSQFNRFPVQAKAAVQAKAYYGLGTVFRLQGETEKSLQAHQKQLAMAETCSDVKLKIQALVNLGVVYYSREDFPAAVDFFDQSLRCSTQENVKSYQSKICGYIASCCVELKNYEGAIKYFTMEIELSGEKRDMVGQCVATGNLGLAYQCSKEHSNAETSLLKHVALANSISPPSENSSPLIMNAHLTLGKFYASTEQFSKALPYFKQVLLVAEKCDEDVQCSVLFTLGYIYFRLEEFRSSLRYYLHSLNVSKNLPHQPNLHKIFYNLGLLNQILGRFKVAGKCYEKFYKICSNRNDHRSVFRALGSIGDVCVLTKEMEAAKTFYEQQLQLSVDFGEVELEIEANCSLGFVNLKMLVYDMALLNFTKMLNLCKDHGDLCGQCQSTLYLGRVQMKLNNFHVATQYFNEALKLAQVLNDKTLVLDVFNSKADCEMCDQEFKVAIETYKKVLQLLEEGEGTKSQSEVVGNCSNLNIQVASDVTRHINVNQSIASCYQKLEDVWAVVEQYQTLVKFCESQHRWIDAAKALHNMADVLVLENEDEKALTVFKYLLSLCENYNNLNLSDISKCSPNVKFLVDKSFLCSTLYDYGSFLMDLQRFQEAIPVLRKSLELTGGDSGRDNDSSLSLGICYDKLQQDNQMADNYYQMAIRMAAEAHDKAKLAITQLYYGSFLFHSNISKEKSLSLLNECLELSCELDDIEVKHSATSKLAAVNFDLGDYQNALMHYDHAIAYLVDLESTSDLSTEQWLEKMSWTVNKAKCLLFLDETSKCSVIVEHSIDKQLLARVAPETIHEIVQLFVSSCEIKVGLTVEKDYKRSLVFSDVIKFLKSRTLNLNANEMQPMVSMFTTSKIDLLLEKSYRFLNRCLEDEQNLYMAMHCADKVELIWIFNKNVRECFSINLENLEQMTKISGGETCSQLFSFLAAQSKLDWKHGVENWNTIMLSETIEAALLEHYTTTLRLVVFLDHEHSVVPFKLLRLSSGRYLSDVFEIETRACFELDSFSLPDREFGNDVNEEQGEMDDKLVVMFGPKSRRCDELKVYETMSRLCGTENESSSSAWVDSESPDCKQILFRVLTEKDSYQMVVICITIVETDDGSDSSFQELFFTRNACSSQSSSEKHCESLHVSELQALSIANKNIVLLIPSANDCNFEFDSYCRRLFYLSCALLNSGASSVLLSHLPSNSNSNVLVSFYHHFTSCLLEGESVNAAACYALRQIRKSSDLVSDFLTFPYLFNITQSNAYCSLNFNNRPIFQEFANVLKPCSEFESSKCNLPLILKLLNKAASRLASNKRNPVVCSLEKLSTGSNWLHNCAPFLISLRYKIDKNSLCFPVVDYAKRLAFFAELIDLLIKLKKCKLHSVIGTLMENYEVERVVRLKEVLKCLFKKTEAANAGLEKVSVLVELNEQSWDDKHEPLLCQIGIQISRASQGRLLLEMSRRDFKSIEQVLHVLSKLLRGPQKSSDVINDEELEQEEVTAPAQSHPQTCNSVSVVYTCEEQIVGSGFELNRLKSQSDAADVFQGMERNRNWFVENESDSAASATLTRNSSARTATTLSSTSSYRGRRNRDRLNELARFNSSDNTPSAKASASKKIDSDDSTSQQISMDFYRKLNEGSLTDTCKANPNLVTDLVPMSKLNYDIPDTSEFFTTAQVKTNVDKIRPKALDLISSRSAFTPVVPRSQFFTPQLDANFNKRACSSSIESQLVSSTGSLQQRAFNSKGLTNFSKENNWHGNGSKVLGEESSVGYRKPSYNASTIQRQGSLQMLNDADEMQESLAERTVLLNDGKNGTIKVDANQARMFKPANKFNL